MKEISLRSRSISASASVFLCCMSERFTGMPFFFMMPRYTAVGLSTFSTRILCFGR